MLSNLLPYLIAAPVVSFALLAMFYRSRSPRRLRAWNREDEIAVENVKNSEKPGQNFFLNNEKQQHVTEIRR